MLVLLLGGCQRLVITFLTTLSGFSPAAVTVFIKKKNKKT